MNQETYNALKRVMSEAQETVCDRGLHKEFKQVEDWIDEVSKEYQDEPINNKGGKTPKKLLELFTKAIEEERPWTASEYFYASTKEEQDEWKRIMINTYEAGNFLDILKNLKKAQPEADSIIGDKFYQFITRDKDNNVILHLDMIQVKPNFWQIDNI